MISRTHGAAMVALLALAACRSKSPAASATSEAGTASSAHAAPAVAAAASAPTDAAAPDVIGMVPRAAVVAEAEKANDAAFGAHRKGKFEESRDGFRRAVELDPDFTLARFNLACALTRTGALDEAERELTRVLREDLVTFRRSFAKDADLEALRASSTHASRIHASIERVAAESKPRIARGLRALLWAPSSAARWVTNPDQRAVAQPSVLRVGVYDAETQRFIALAPRQKAPLTALWGNETPYAIVLTGAWNPNCGGDLCQWIDGVAADVFDDSLSGEPIARITTKGQEGSAIADWAGGELTLEVLDAFSEKEPGVFVHTWSPSAGVRVKKQAENAKARKPGAPPLITASLVHPIGNVTERRAGGVSYDPKTQTVTLATGASVVTTDPPKRKKSPDTIALSPNGRRALLVWDATPDCDPEHDRSDLKLRRVAMLVDFDAKTSSIIADVKGAVDVGFDARGEAYVQKDAALEHVTASGAAEPLPSGLVLSPPTLNEWQCIGFW